jgi:hypothetical protein
MSLLSCGHGLRCQLLSFDNNNTEWLKCHSTYVGRRARKTPLSGETVAAMVTYAQEEMAAAGQAPDSSTTLFQGCTVTVAQASSADGHVHAAHKAGIVGGWSSSCMDG